MANPSVTFFQNPAGAAAHWISLNICPSSHASPSTFPTGASRLPSFSSSGSIGGGVPLRFAFSLSTPPPPSSSSTTVPPPSENRLAFRQNAPLARRRSEGEVPPPGDAGESGAVALAGDATRESDEWFGWRAPSERRERNLRMGFVEVLDATEAALPRMERFFAGGERDELVGLRLWVCRAGSAAVTSAPLGVDGTWWAVPWSPLPAWDWAGDEWLDVGCDRSGFRGLISAGGDGGGEGAGGGIGVPSVREE